MKKELIKDNHYYQGVDVVCACGNRFKVNSTAKEIKTEICSACHPYYTGNEKLIDTAGRIDKFKARMKKTNILKNDKKSKKESQ
ncbi:50S ribosomal protein L31 [Candidatus Berkelbacteria bacterium CG_4_10_14_0_8_um_filter_35_9_33_8]|uniref:50S ribosomal protein L31 n=1 Tax=Candidatus Berkelbacteria bacterium CG_4_10_14_0_2_um_filter_35_9_33_12 TaxID=1974499 RepID=A0A2M7W4E8_9BACT|nr:MAG: 50S ribosomal protein L31 [Candidatus Berkelbacteria bacterium CG23_combo_of_CG06-09_8_20_14_all_33_15]PIZ28043.1 MAG: 50S ribosomal protein L31 [Candidatus Berkelbacteria bacterium CG_4_10_14_0_8_um_filter_35_9_33_8]PJA20643.1 MAG: 50S ribosomal protein L31 [Candidatus Berkelbacteria bacterium CG_4_10_14_0_2_um_filter_35_9_33_12]